MRPVIARLALLVIGVLLPGALVLVLLFDPSPPPPTPTAPFSSVSLPEVSLPSGTDTASLVTRASIQRGERIYQRLCYHCHGRQGLGDNNPYMASIGHAPAAHADQLNMQKLSDTDIFTAIRDGVKDERGWLTMPPWSSVLTEAEMWDVIVYMRRLPQPAPLQSENP